MMTAVGVPGTVPLTSHHHHHHHLNGAMSAANSNIVAAAAAAAAAHAHANSSNASGTTASSLCSTPVNIFGQNGLNAAAAQALSFMQSGGIPYYSTQLSSMTAPYGTAMAGTNASLAGANNAFEGFPIVLLPQNGSSALPLASIQKQLIAQQQQIAAQPKIDTSKHFHVFVGDLSSEVDNTVLKNAFTQFGEISEVKVIRDSQSLKSRGYGFVTYPNKEHAEVAIEKMNGQMVGRRAVRTNWAVRRTAEDEKKALSYEQIYNATPVDNTTVYIGNLNSNTTEENVKKAFLKFGEIKEIRMFAPQNYGFVTFETKDGATKAILEMSFEEMDGQMLRCSWGRPAEPINNQLNPSSLLALSQLAGLTAAPQTPQLSIFANPLYPYGPNLMPSWQ